MAIDGNQFHRGRRPGLGRAPRVVRPQRHPGRRRPRPARRRHPRLRPALPARWSTTYAGSAPARWSAWSTPTSTSTTPSATPRSARRTARSRSTRTRRPPPGPCRRASGSRACTTRSPTTRTPTRSATTEIVPADHTFSSAVALDLGDRAVELVHPGRGHTGGDLVVRVPDVDVVLAGDLVEESARAATSRLRRGLLPAGVAAQPRHRARPAHGCDRRRPRSRRAGRPRVRRGPAQRHRHRGRDDPRPRRPRRTPRAGAGRGRLALRQGAARERRRRGYEQLPRGPRQLPLA